jgi:hypothetical protein
MGVSSPRRSKFDDVHDSCRQIADSLPAAQASRGHWRQTEIGEAHESEYRHRRQVLDKEVPPLLTRRAIRGSRASHRHTTPPTAHLRIAVNRKHQTLSRCASVIRKISSASRSCEYIDAMLKCGLFDIDTHLRVCNDRSARGQTRESNSGWSLGLGVFGVAVCLSRINAKAGAANTFVDW